MGCSEHWQGLHPAQSQQGLISHQAVIAVPALHVSITVVLIGVNDVAYLLATFGKRQGLICGYCTSFWILPIISGKKRHCRNHAVDENGGLSSLISYRIPYQVNSGCLERYAYRGSDIE